MTKFFLLSHKKKLTKTSRVIPTRDKFEAKKPIENPPINNQKKQYVIHLIQIKIYHQIDLN